MPPKKRRTSTPHYKTNSTIDKPVEEELDPAVVFVKNSWVEWDGHWASKLSMFEQYYDQWIGKPPKRDEEWQSQFHKRLSWQGEKALVSRLHGALWPTSAPIDYDVAETPDDVTGILSKSLISHWFKIGMFSIEFIKGMRASAIYGSGFFEDDWYLRKEKVYRQEEKEIDNFSEVVDADTGEFAKDEDGNILARKDGTRKVVRESSKMEVVEDRYRVRKANIFAWRIHPKKLTDDDDYPVIKQEFMNFDDLIERQREFDKYGGEGFDNMDAIKHDQFNPDESAMSRHFKDGDYKDKGKKNKELELLSYWGLYEDKESKKRIPMWIMVVNRKFKIKQVPIPMWHQKSPLFHIVWTEDEKPSYYGIGMVQIGKDAEDRANNVVNIRTDERKKNIKGGGWYNKNDRKIKPRDLHKNVPGFWKPCSDVNNAVRPDIPIPSTPDDYKEEETAVNDHREISGATTSLLPTADYKQQHDTLGGMQLLIGQAAQRLKPDLIMMEMMGIRKMANRAMIMTRQFFSEPKAIELIASQDELKKASLTKIYTMTPEELIGKVNFHSTGLSESLDKSQNIDKLLKYAEVTAKIPAMQAITNYENIGKRIGLWLGFEDIDDFILLNPQDPYQPVQPPAPIPTPGPALPGVPGVPGFPPGVPPPGPLPGAPAAVPVGVTNQANPGQGLPPELLQLIVQSIISGQG